MGKYTKKLHAHRLELLLKDEEGICGKCPASKKWVIHPTDYKWLYSREERFMVAGMTYKPHCKICVEFVDPDGSLRQKTGSNNFNLYRCPCMFLKDPVKDTMKALKRYRETGE